MQTFPIDMTHLVPLAVFGLIAALVWLILSNVAGGRSRARERLKEISVAHRPRSKAAGGLLKQPDKLERVLEKAAPALSKPLLPKTELEQSNLRVKLANAGWRGEGAVSVYLAAKFIGLIVALAIAGVFVISAYGMTQKSLIITVLCGAAGFYLPDGILSHRRKRRQEAIFLALPDALDLLVVCVEAGLGLDAGMQRVSEELASTHPVISQELAISNFQLRMGRSRREVLHDLGVRTGVDDVRGLAALLIQTDRFGSSVSQALRVQSDSMRTRRRQLAEERAAKTAVKLIFPLVLFIFPGIFVVLVGPAAITITRDLFPSMGAG